MGESKNPVECGLHWLTHSGLRQAGQDEATGGVNQGYDWRERRYPFVYSEITGYAVSQFVIAHRWTGDSTYLDYAQQAAQFIIRVQAPASDLNTRGAIAHGLSLPDLKLLCQYYSFDAAMCLQGLLDLYAVRPDSTLLSASRAMGDWLIDRMQQPDGSFLAMYDAETNNDKHIGPLFFDDGGCLHGKHAIGLLKLYTATQETRYADAARRVCDWVLSLQDADGAFRANERVQEIFSHPHCYTTEGLLYAYYVLREDRYLDAARRAGQWLLESQQSDGALEVAYRRSVPLRQRIRALVQPPHVTDATSQSIRIWLSLNALTPSETYITASRNAAAFLRRLQCLDSRDPNMVGGFYFHPRHSMMFAWCAMFAVTALKSVERLESGIDFDTLMLEMF